MSSLLRFMLLGIGIAALSGPAQPKWLFDHGAGRDLRCFVLYAAGAGTVTEDGKKQAAGLGLLYFRGKLAGEAPNLDLPLMVRREFAAIRRNKQVKDIAKSCDTEFYSRGNELDQIGRELKNSER
ncbi:hypothetical protein HMF7854_00125 [Sphingomonas ginkgonis]|uniref:Uncharacterized protein n=1 Tax=Sphingomonas ginkgonis TaxID=2315330 RepID=A0A429V662_9SPHN|nr:hypothetical protein [Sphingomonas ginkgonis]RST29414.1 hypothetical protein HMF7854_00125 [Sphingomonas ginkgonis]